MAVQHLELNIRSFSIDTAAADRLIAAGSGDAALLYLYLLRNQGEYDPAAAGRALHWNRGQLDTALAQLHEFGLAGGAILPKQEEPLPQPDQAPEYTAADIVSELQDQGSPFSALLQEVEQILGRKLPNTQTAALLELYDHVGLPSEVILLLVSWLSEKNQQKYGTGKRLTMAYVKRVGYQWKEQSIDTLEAADEYIKSYNLRQSRQGALLNALGIHGRPASVTETKFLVQWIDWRFPPETVAVAYDITVTALGRLDWRYCNGILRRWHEAGLHTPEEVKAERKPEPRAAAGKRSAPVQKDRKTLEAENRQNMLEMQRLLEHMKQE